MALRLAGERAPVIQGTDNQGWVREVTPQDSLPGLKINQKGTGRIFDFQDGGVSKMYLPDGGDVTLSSGLVFIGGNITGGSGFQIATSTGNLIVAPAGEITTTKRYAYTGFTPRRIATTDANRGPYRNELLGSKLDIGDNVLTDIITVAVPNAGTGLTSLIILDWAITTVADRTKASGQIRVDIARRYGAATVAALAVTLAGVTQQSGPYAETLAVTWSVDAIVGADDSTQTFHIEATSDSGAGGQSSVYFFARVLSGGEYGAPPAEVTMATAA